jgi:hypothetical protein
MRAEHLEEAHSQRQAAAAAHMLVQERPALSAYADEYLRRYVGNDDPGGRRAWLDKLRRLSHLLRDIFANPFRPIAFDRSWRSGAAVGIATSVYESGDFSALPILADALEEVGCTVPALLTHCRGPGPHVRGCWVVDLVLGRG